MHSMNRWIIYIKITHRWCNITACLWSQLRHACITFKLLTSHDKDVILLLLLHRWSCGAQTCRTFISPPSQTLSLTPSHYHVLVLQCFLSPFFVRRWSSLRKGPSDKKAPRGKQAVENGLSSFFLNYYYYYHRLLMLHSLLPWWSGVGEYKPPPPPPPPHVREGAHYCTHSYTHTHAHWNMQIYIRKCNLKWISLTFSALNSSFYVKHEKD